MCFPLVVNFYNQWMSIQDIRRRNLLALIGERRISDFARRYDLNEKYIRLIKGGQSEIGNNFAKKIEEAVARVSGGNWNGWMDRDHGHDLEADAILVGRRWSRLRPNHRAFVLGQLMLAERLDDAEATPPAEKAASYAQILDEFRRSPIAAAEDASTAAVPQRRSTPRTVHGALTQPPRREKRRA